MISVFNAHPLKYRFRPSHLITEHAYHDPFGDGEAGTCRVVVDDADEGVSRCNRPPWEHFRFCAESDCMSGEWCP